MLAGITKGIIQKLHRLDQTTDIYQIHQVCFNHFLKSALGVIFLAVNLDESEDDECQEDGSEDGESEDGESEDGESEDDQYEGEGSESEEAESEGDGASSSAGMDIDLPEPTSEDLTTQISVLQISDRKSNGEAGGVTKTAKKRPFDDSDDTDDAAASGYKRAKMEHWRERFNKFGWT
ncbi:hypothetical protein FNYG_11982 [Fusarium nygamai]|uniref:Uncharacterized protein n=1 Tax=Gibberella nygamai TaxID=42673 RepID=A0A2K0VX78_GIBNY|nr:hypothetical protein FNYG_11982 [Fusarium nygamai]